MLSRREVLIGSAAASLAGCASERRDAGPTTTTGRTGSLPSTTTPPNPCALTPQVTAGPYYLEDHLVRRDITEGRPGVPLEFQIRVLSSPSCAPLADAAVDIWHCNAGGEYSGSNGNSLEATQSGGTNDLRYLRGVQLTSPDGVATFTTIFPGWYEGRTVHIHLTVLERGTPGTTYAGGETVHIGQAFFDEAVTAEILRRDPYRNRAGQRTTNSQDTIFAEAGDLAVAALTPRGTGYHGQFVCVINADRSGT